MVDVVWRGAVAAAVVVLARVSGSEAQPPAVPVAYAIFALERVELGGKTRIIGDVGVNDGEAVIGKRARVSGAAAGETIQLASGADVGRLYCVLVVGGTEPCEALTVPIVESAQLPIVQVTPGVEDVHVPRKGRRVPLDPGAYRDLTVGPASELRLHAGEYDVRRLQVGPRAALVCEGPCAIRVRDGISVGPAARMANDGAGAIDLAVQGDGEGVGFKTGPRATVDASIYAPATAIRLGGAGRYTGTFVGRVVRVGPRSKVSTVTTP